MLLFVIGLAVSLLQLTSCGNQSNSQANDQQSAKVEQTSTDKTMKMVGNDRDEHGCIASAGYQWSELLKDCIRPFEKGIKMTSATDKDAVSAAYLVFNADSSKVELFLPKEKNRPILEQDAKDKENWSNGNEWTVKLQKGTLNVFSKGTLQYVEVAK